jgi:hypothetical protein
MSSAVKPNCRTCGFPINEPSHLIWNGHHFHTDHMPKSEPPPRFEVVQIQADHDCPGLWIGFKTAADRERAMEWFTVTNG